MLPFLLFNRRIQRGVLFFYALLERIADIRFVRIDRGVVQIVVRNIFQDIDVCCACWCDSDIIRQRKLPISSDSKDMELEATILRFFDGIISFVGDFTGHFCPTAALGVCGHDRHGVDQADVSLYPESDSGGKSF